MKRAMVVLVLVVGLAGGVFAQTTWERLYDYDGGYSVIQTPDSNYVVAGDEIIKITPTGDIVWVASLVGHANDIINTSDGAYLVTGQHYDKLLVRKLDSLGNVVGWMSYYDERPGETVGNSIVESYAGGYVIAGYTNSFGAGDYDVYVLKLDEYLDTLWSFTWGGTGNDIATSIINAESYWGDSCLVLTGSYYEEAGREDQEVIMMIWDYYSSCDCSDTLACFGHYGVARDVIRDESDSTFVTIGSKIHVIDNVSFMRKYDRFIGGLLWERCFFSYGYSLVKTNDGAYVAVGYIEDYVYGDDYIYIVKVSNSGDFLWSRTYHICEWNSVWGYDIENTNDGGFIVAGSSLGAGGVGGIYVIKTDSLGLVSSEDIFVDILLDWEIIRSKDAHEHENPRAAIGRPDSNFVSLGIGGWIEMRLCEFIKNSPGNDIKVYESGDMELEGFTVFGKNHFTDSWIEIGSGIGSTCFDLSSCLLDSVRYIRIVDDSSICTGITPGFDLDAIGEILEPVNIIAIDKPLWFELNIHPNPFNSSCHISTPAGAKVEIFNLSGQKVAEFDGGEILWQPEKNLPSGIYLIHASLGDKSIAKRTIYLK